MKKLLKQSLSLLLISCLITGCSFFKKDKTFESNETLVQIIYEAVNEGNQEKLKKVFSKQLLEDNPSTHIEIVNLFNGDQIEEWEGIEETNNEERTYPDKKAVKFKTLTFSGECKESNMKYYFTLEYSPVNKHNKKLKGVNFISIEKRNEYGRKMQEIKFFVTAVDINTEEANVENTQSLRV